MNDPILDFIADFHKRNGYAPSVREIGKAVGLRSTSSVYFRLRSLAADGKLRFEPGKVRTVRVP